tara:strand:- start:144 stop:359 length:216 start_codon:yes stop_codon:yes gene_type:complete
MIILTIVGLTFFVAVGYFAYNFSQCIGTFTRLDKIIPTKIFGVVGLLAYIYVIYANQDVVIAALKQPLTNL